MIHLSPAIVLAEVSKPPFPKQLVLVLIPEEAGIDDLVLWNYLSNPSNGLVETVLGIRAEHLQTIDLHGPSLLDTLSKSLDAYRSQPRRPNGS